MKNSLFVILFLASGLTYGKEMPSPFWYNLSKKVLVETQRLITDHESPQPTIKPKTTKTTKILKVPLKCQQSKEPRIQTISQPGVKDTFQDI